MHTLILAFVQSISEFLPVSSSGHLILFQFLMNWKSQGIVLDISLHIGTLLAVCIYFRKEVCNLFLALFYPKAQKKLLINLIVATLPIPIFALCFLPLIRQMRNPYVIAITLIIFGILLWLADKYSAQSKEQITVKNAFVIGLAQCLSLIPGVSRSGITITAARLCGISRQTATHFSMLLSIPTISLAGLWAIFKSIQNNNIHALQSMSYMGILYAFIFGLIVIHLLLRFVKKHSFGVFMVYRVLLGMFILLYLAQI